MLTAMEKCLVQPLQAKHAHTYALHAKHTQTHNWTEHNWHDSAQDGYIRRHRHTHTHTHTHIPPPPLSRPFKNTKSLVLTTGHQKEMDFLENSCACALRAQCS